AEEIEFAVYDEVENGIIPIRRDPATHFPIVPSMGIGERFRESKCGIHQIGGTLFAVSDLKTIVEKQVRRTHRIVLDNTDAELRSIWEFRCRLVLEEIASLQEKTELVQQVRREGVGVCRARIVVIVLSSVGRARHSGKLERIQLWVAEAAERDAQFVFVGEREIELHGEFVSVVRVRALKIPHAGGVGRNQPELDIFSANRIYLTFFNDRARGQVRIWLEVGVGLKKGCDAGILGAGCSAGADCLSVGEVAVQLRRSENRSRPGGLLLGKPLSLVPDEKEESIFAVDEFGHGDWAAEGRAVLIAFEHIARKRRLRRLIEIIIGIEGIVAQEFKGAAVPLIRSG